MAAHSQHGSHDSTPAGAAAPPNPGHAGHYRRFAAMLLVSFVAMYFLMYAMVDGLDNVYASWNQVYMAGVMTAAMLVIELALMWSMYPNRSLNIALLAVGLIAGLGCWFGIREQAAIDDSQFLRSMIPHHAGAILMCGEAKIVDPEIQALCRQIIASQEAEIAQMKSLLDER